MAAAAITMAIAGISSILLAGGTRPARADTTYTVEVGDDGINPSVCSVNRGDEVVWKNVGHQVHRIYAPSLDPAKPFIDTGDLQPGDVSSAWSFDSGVRSNYYDYYNQSHTAVVQTPLRNNTGTVSCSPLPPTPTPTPTRTPAPPTPTPVVPAGCKWIGCALAAAISHD